MNDSKDKSKLEEVRQALQQFVDEHDLNARNHSVMGLRKKIAALSPELKAEHGRLCHCVISLILPIGPQELERREQAARRLRERYLSHPLCDPYYKERDRRSGMAFWRAMQSSAVLSDGD